MSAMHWEARRRQNVLDRRMASKTKQGLTADRQMQGTTGEGQSETPVTPAVSSEPLVIDKKILCRCQLERREQYSAKIENRYTSGLQNTGVWKFTMPHSKEIPVGPQKKSYQSHF